MKKYIDAEKLKKTIDNYQEGAKCALNPIDGDADYYKGKIDACKDLQGFITSLQQENEIIELSFKGGTYKVNGEEKSFKGGKAKVIILEINQEEETL